MGGLWESLRGLTVGGGKSCLVIWMLGLTAPDLTEVDPESRVAPFTLFLGLKEPQSFP